MRPVSVKPEWSSEVTVHRNNMHFEISIVNSPNQKQIISVLFVKYNFETYFQSGKIAHWKSQPTPWQNQMLYKWKIYLKKWTMWFYILSTMIKILILDLKVFINLLCKAKVCIKNYASLSFSHNRTLTSFWTGFPMLIPNL